MENKKTKQLGRIKVEDPLVFQDLFHKHYRPLVLFAFDYLKDLDAAKEVVQVFFVSMWDKRFQLHIRPNAKPFFYQSIKNACINKKKHSLKHIVLVDGGITATAEKDVLQNMYAIDLEEQIFRVIDQMPEKRRQVFLLSRVEGMRHAEIAKKMNISQKTVENQIGIALKKLARFKELLAITALVVI